MEPTSEIARGNQIVQELLDLWAVYEAKNWKEFGKKPNLMYSVYEDHLLASKGVDECDVALDDIVGFLQEAESAVVADPMCEQNKEVFHGHGYEIYHMKYKGIWPVAGRDFVMQQMNKRVGDKHYFLSRSTDFNIPATSKYVRGLCHAGGYCVEKIGEKRCRITYISDVDLKGSIPNMIKNVISKGQAEVPHTLKKYLEKRFK